MKSVNKFLSLFTENLLEFSGLFHCSIFKVLLTGFRGQLDYHIISILGSQHLFIFFLNNFTIIFYATKYARFNHFKPLNTEKRIAKSLFRV